MSSTVCIKMHPIGNTLKSYNIIGLGIFVEIMVIVDTFFFGYKLAKAHHSQPILLLPKVQKENGFQVWIEWQSLSLYFVTKNQRTRMTSSAMVIHKLEFAGRFFAAIYAQRIQTIILWINCALDSNIHRLLKKLVVNKCRDPLLHKLVIAHIHTIPYQSFMGKGGE